MKLQDVYVAFHEYKNGHHSTYYIRLDMVLNDHQDTYQDERDDRLFVWDEDCNAYVPISITH